MALRIGKVRESVWNRSVLKELYSKTEYDPCNGEPLSRMAFSSHCVTGWTLAPLRMVYNALNDLWAKGAEPAVLLLDLIMPPDTEERQLKLLLREVRKLCEQEKVKAVPGHVAVSPSVGDLHATVTGIGLTGQDQGPDGKKKASFANLDLVVCGRIGLEGTAVVASGYREDLESRYPPSFVDTAAHLYDRPGMKSAAAVLHEENAAIVSAPGEGGIFGGLWELAAATKVGLEIELEKIPMRQHVVEVCEYFDLNPYMLRTGGCLLALCREGGILCEKLAALGITGRVIGNTTGEAQRRIHYDDEIRFLEPPKIDELYKMVEKGGNNA